MTPFAWALSAIREQFGEPIFYTGAGLTRASILAIKSDVAADAFQGSGATARRISFEVAQAAIPGRPSKKDEIEHGGVLWLVNDITQRDDVGAWELVVVRLA